MVNNLIRREQWVLLALFAVGASVVGCARPLPPDLPPNLTKASYLSEAMGGGASAAAATAGVEQAQPTGWASLAGKFSLTEAVQPASIPVNKDGHVCGNSAPNEEVVCGPNGELRNVLIFLSTKIPSESEPWVHPDYTASANAEVVFDQKSCVFLSHVFPLRATQKLKIVNSDTVGHNTNIPAFSYNKIIPEKASDLFTDVKATVQPAAVSCSIHPWMNAYVFASKTPYVAVTDPQGAFEMKNLPAGVELEFTVWQEKVGYPSAAKVDGAEQTWKKGKFKLKLENNESKQLQVVFDAARFR